MQTIDTTATAISALNVNDVKQGMVDAINSNPEFAADWNKANNVEAVTEAFEVNVRKGRSDSSVSEQWRSRPHDQRFVSLSDLSRFVGDLANNSEHHLVESRDIEVIVSPDRPDDLQIAYNVRHDQYTLNPSHYSFGQIARLADAPASYLRDNLPAVLAGACLQYGLQVGRSLPLMTYFDQRDMTLRAATGPDYGRITDASMVEAVRRIAGNGTGDTRWKVPGNLEWSSMNGGKVLYNPFVDVTKENTTLYASDRDVWMFLVDDTHPINIGTENEPDLVFRGFYVWNSEVGAGSAGVSAFIFRGVCCNRILWGVDKSVTKSFRHSKNAPQRFNSEIRPALMSMSEASAMPIVSGVRAAQAAVVADDDEGAFAFLKKNTKASDTAARKILQAVKDEEGRPARSVWDMVQGLTAYARSQPNSDTRVNIEEQAGELMAKAARRA